MQPELHVGWPCWLTGTWPGYKSRFSAGPDPASEVCAARAATSHPAIPFAQTHQAQPDTTPSGTFTYAWPCTYGFCYDYISCTAGNHSAPANMKAGTQDSWVLNGCNVRVWLSQYANGTGYKLCLSPNAGTTRVWLYKAYADVGVSTNGAAC